MNFETDFQTKFEKWCNDEHKMVVWYKDYDKMVTTDNINEVEAFAFCNPYKTVKLPKQKLITLDYVINKVSEQKEFINLAIKFRTVLDSGYNCYPTSYGFGVWTLFSKVGDVTKIENLLRSADIEYRCEYSDAFWVYRFILSKSKENLIKMNNYLG